VVWLGLRYLVVQFRLDGMTHLCGLVWFSFLKFVTWVQVWYG
jgi:hypothetical protein